MARIYAASARDATAIAELGRGRERSAGLYLAAQIYV
jgi:hypothetical protein